MKEKNIGLLFFDPFSINKGTAALSYSVVYISEEIAARENIKFNYIFLEPMSSPLKYSVSHELDINGKSVPIKMYRCFPANTVKEKIVKIIFYKEYLESLKVDYVFDIGEGDSYSDIYGFDRFDRFDKMKLVYLSKKIPVGILPQTLGPFNMKKTEKRAKKTLAKCSFIGSRDDETSKYIKELISEKEIFQTPDLAFFLPYNRNTFDSAKIHVGLNVSGLIWYGGYTRDNQFNLTANYAELIEKTIKYFLNETNVVLHLIPHVLSEKNSLDNDYHVCFHLFQKYSNSNLVLAPFFPTPIDAKNYISGMDFFMGARLHATIAAFSSGVPVCPMAYSRKFTGLYEDTYNYNHVCNLMTQSTDIAFDVIKNSYLSRNLLKEECLQAMDMITSKIVDIENVLKAVLS